MSNILQIKPLGFPWETQDPFLFCAYHMDEFPEGNDQMGPDPALKVGRQIGQDFVIKDGWRMYHGQNIPGFPYHPHKGFETITINKQGIVDHTDSLGAAGRFMRGDVQWMTAGKGVQHSEMFPLVHKDKENTLEIFQVWLNLPSRSKLVDPHFKMLWKEDIPVTIESDANGKKTIIDVIAGSYKEIKPLSPTPNSWAADPQNGVAVWTVKMEANATWKLPAASQNVNRSIYFYEGTSANLDGQSMKSNSLAHLRPDTEILIENENADAFFLLLQGKPINEPVAQYGPFVMNTQQEIQEAFEEYRRTQFGGWPWQETEQAHPREKGRFALHADGREEIPGNS